MTTERMNIHKALCEVKMINARIESEIAGAVFCCANKHINKQINGKSIGETQTAMRSSYNKIDDLIRRRNAIKKAISLSNATAKITIGDKEMTVAEAIELKNNGIDHKQRLLKMLSSQLERAKYAIEDANGEKLSKKADDYIISMYGAKEKTVENDEIEKARKVYIENNSYELIEGFDTEKAILELKTEIDTFVTNVDSALSTSNAVTEIEIEY